MTSNTPERLEEARIYCSRSGAPSSRSWPSRGQGSFSNGCRSAQRHVAHCSRHALRHVSVAWLGSCGNRRRVGRFRRESIHRAGTNFQPGASPDGNGSGSPDGRDCIGYFLRSATKGGNVRKARTHSAATRTRRDSRKRTPRTLTYVHEQPGSPDRETEAAPSAPASGHAVELAPAASSRQLFRLPWPDSRAQPARAETQRGPHQVTQSTSARPSAQRRGRSDPAVARGVVRARERPPG